MFHDPSVWLLLLLVALPLLWWRWSRPRTTRSIAFSSIAPLEALGRSWRVRLRWLVPALRSAVLIILIVCLARPQRANERTRIFSEGVAIQLVLDRSGSMRAMDFQLDGRTATRLEAVARVVRDFVLGSGDLPGRPDDLIGLITFASFADSVCPLTLDHAHLARTVDATRVATQEEGAGTAIGDALALGVERMRGLDERRDLARQPIKSRVMILLSDGASGEGEIDPLTAADMAAAFGIRVYTIGAGSDEALVPMPTTDPFSGRQVIQRVRVSIDEETLQEIANRTGGQYFRATDSDSLERVYARIDELERTEIEQRRYLDAKELAVEPVTLAGSRVPPLLAFGFIVLVIEQFLRNTVFRRHP